MNEEAALSELIASANIEAVFQPVVELETRSIVGFEALMRGPQGSPFEKPTLLFAQALDAGLPTELDLVCHRRAIASAREMPSSKRLFLKVLASSFEDRELCGERWLQQVEDAGMEASQVVLEISERVAVFDYQLLRERLDGAREHGVHVAIDNVGSGHSGFDEIVELRPDYIKLHRSVVTDCELSQTKQDMIKTFTAMATKANAQLIAHGVEKSEEIRCLTELGVALGQGYLFGRPGAVPLSAERV